MATMTLSAVESSSPRGNHPLEPPARAHTNNHDRAERGLLTYPPEMQSSEIRSRLPSERDSHPGKDKVDLADSMKSLNPTSSRGTNPTQAYRFASLARTVWEAGTRFVQKPALHADPPEKESLKEPHRYNKITYEKVDDYPEGYPQLSTLMYNDDTFANVRGFRNLSTRILLHLQVEITELEKELHELDASDAVNPILKFRLQGNENYHGWDSTQRDLLSKIRVKYCEYADVVMRQSHFRTLDKTTRRNHRQLFEWMWNEKPLSESKDDFIRHADDFVSLAKNTGNDRFLEDAIESYLDNHPGSWIKNFLRTDVERKKTGDDYVDIYSPLHLTLLAKGLGILLTVASLLVPIFLLFLVRMSREWIATVALGFVLIFAIMISVMTSARLQDILYGTASFSAVLVAVIGNMNQGASTGS